MPLIEDIVRQNEETSDRICQNATGYLVVNNKMELAVRTSYENTTTQSLIRNIAGKIVAQAASCVRDLDPSDDLAFLRIKTKNYEYLIAPEEEFTIIVQQN